MAIRGEISEDYCNIIERRLNPNNFEKVEERGIFYFIAPNVKYKISKGLIKTKVK